MAYIHLDALEQSPHLTGYIYMKDLSRMDRKGDGKPCGRSFINRKYRCSDDKKAQLANDLKTGDEGAKKRVEQAKKNQRDRNQLKREVARDKGRKATSKGDGFLENEELKKLPKSVRIAHDFMVSSNLYTKEKPAIDLTAVGENPEELEKYIKQNANPILSNKGKILEYDKIPVKTSASPFTVMATVDKKQGRNQKGIYTTYSLSFPTIQSSSSKVLGIQNVEPVISTIKTTRDKKGDVKLNAKIDINRTPKGWSEYKKKYNDS